MKQGFVKVTAVTPKVRVADVEHNKKEIFRLIDESVANGAKVIVFPELCVTGATCGDLFAQSILIQKAEQALHQLSGGNQEGRCAGQRRNRPFARTYPRCHCAGLR